MSSPALVYIDTMLFVYELIKNPNRSDNVANLASKANKFFQDIVNGIYEGVTTTFTELEYKGVVKRALSNISKSSLTKNQELDAASAFRSFIRQTGIMLMDADILSIASVGRVDLFSSTYPIIDKSNPHYDPHGPTDSNPWRSIGGSDGITVNLAIRTNAKFIATSDEAFRQLNNSSLQPLLIQDSY